MKMKFLIPLACIVLFTACNNSTENNDKKDDSEMSDMNHVPAPGVKIPDLPAIPDGAKVFFKNLKNNATISSPFILEMGVEIIKVDTAGPVVAGIGHHHLLIDAEDSLVAGSIVPTDSAHIHFGKGQTEYLLSLSPGMHKLTLQMADGLHRSYGSKLSATITINVKE